MNRISALTLGLLLATVDSFAYGSLKTRLAQQSASPNILSEVQGVNLGGGVSDDCGCDAQPPLTLPPVTLPACDC